MFLKSISLQNFRNYKKAEFHFSKDATLIVGPNTAGKTNLIEAIFFLSTGKSFRGSDADVILFGEDVGRIKTEVESDSTEGLEIVFANRDGRFIKKYLVNGVSKQRVNFVGRLPSVLFMPADLEIVTASPGKRRDYLDSVLEQVDSDYRRSLRAYKKALYSRNRLLENAKKLGRKDDLQFEYWDNILIVNGNTLTHTRERFLEFINSSVKNIFNFKVVYEPSIISKERLLQYKDAELAATVTLVGPHRDDFRMEINIGKSKSYYNIKTFGSRGQQRLAVLQLKITELSFLEQKLSEKPLLLLDDIFSELDSENIKLVLETTGSRQTIITTTHKEFVPEKILGEMQEIGLGK